MTQLPPPGGVMLVIDLSCFVHRFWATMQHRAHFGVIDFLRKVLDRLRPEYALVAADTNGVPTFRHALAPETYKAQRGEKDPILVRRLRWTQHLCEDVLGLPVVQLPGFEADDIIATAARVGLADGLSVVILGLDKDLMQLVGPNCVLWDGKDRVVGVPEVQTRFGVTPSQVGDYLALVGDKVDNIPGVAGVGPKAAADLLAQCGSIQGILERAAKRGCGGTVAKVARAREAVELSQKLVRLADVSLPYEVEDMRCSN